MILPFEVCNKQIKKSLTWSNLLICWTSPWPPCFSHKHNFHNSFSFQSLYHTRSADLTDRFVSQKISCSNLHQCENLYLTLFNNLFCKMLEKIMVEFVSAVLIRSPNPYVHWPWKFSSLNDCVVLGACHSKTYCRILMLKKTEFLFRTFT